MIFYSVCYANVEFYPNNMIQNFPICSFKDVAQLAAEVLLWGLPVVVLP